MLELIGNYFYKQFSPPKKIGEQGKRLEEIVIFPTNEDSFIDVKLLEGQDSCTITISYEGAEWKGTMKELIEKLTKI